MKTWVLVSGLVAVTSLCFIDDGIIPEVAKAGRLTLAISSGIFVVTGVLALIF